MRIAIAVAMFIVAIWAACGGIGLLFWLGDHFYGGPFSDSFMPAVIYFGGLPILLMMVAAIIIVAVKILLDGELK